MLQSILHKFKNTFYDTMVTTQKLKCLTCNNISIKKVSRVSDINKHTIIIVYCSYCDAYKLHMVL